MLPWHDHPMPQLDELEVEHGGDLLETTGAVFDVDRVYRYALGRGWGSGPTAVWVLLNPSTATALVTDATVRRCVAFSRRERCGSLLILNLFAYRATNPRELAGSADPVGPRNAEFLRICTRHDGPTIAGWGAHGELHDRGRQVATDLAAADVELLCLDTTTGGQPHHPLRLHRATPLRPYRPPSPDLETGGKPVPTGRTTR